MKSSAFITSFLYTTPLYGLHPHFYKKILISPFVVFKKSQPPINRGLSLWILHMIPSNSPNGEVGEGGFQFDQPYKQTESKIKVTRKISSNK